MRLNWKVGISHCIIEFINDKINIAILRTRNCLFKEKTSRQKPHFIWIICTNFPLNVSNPHWETARDSFINSWEFMHSDGVIEYLIVEILSLFKIEYSLMHI